MVPEVVREIDMVVHAALDFSPVREDIRCRIIDAYPRIKDELIDYCRRKKLLPFVARFMLALGLDIDMWKDILESYRNRNSNAKQELERVFHALRAHGAADCYPIENFAALLASGEDIGLFASGDIDVYAGQADHDTVHAVMTELGYTCNSANSYQGNYYRKDSSPVGINMMWMWQSRRNIPFRTVLDAQKIGGGALSTFATACRYADVHVPAPCISSSLCM